MTTIADNKNDDIVLLKPCVQQYAWGKRGLESTVARLYCASTSDPIDATAPYAELWIGTHPNGPATVQTPPTDQPCLLSKWLAEQPAKRLGDACVARFGADELPFLFKVLSVQQALSIQAHPDNDRAQRLHQSAPQHYKDPRHKPEMAIALTPFEALCGFRTVHEIVTILNAYPELADAIGSDARQALVASVDNDANERAALALALRSLMHVTDDQLVVLLNRLIERLKSTQSTAHPLDDLLLRLHTAYPGDVGVFCAMLLNHMTLKPGEGVFLAANEPHAYLFGDCVECMACSDNVVRAGLTPKFKDKDTLVDMLTYTRGPVTLLGGNATGAAERDYPSPVPEFCVKQVDVSDVFQLPARNGPTVVLVVEGSGQLGGVSVTAGNSVFVPHQTVLEIRAKDKLKLYAAMTNF